MPGKFKITLQCLKKTSETGSRTYPMYIGFLTAAELSNNSLAPAFPLKATNQKIASSLNEGLNRWQRPLDKKRSDLIAETFSLEEPDGPPGELMPNPVLLALQADATVENYTDKDGVCSFVLASSDEEPLVVLDGQHRIEGLSKSEQAANPIPFVLLMADPKEKHSQSPYSLDVYAKLFTQVTTSSVDLSKPHKEWLTYLFDLGQYAPPKGEARHQAMDVVRALCSSGNSFLLNRIVFRPDDREGDKAFAWTNTDWVNMVAASYYGVAADPQPPKEVAKAVSAALKLFEVAVGKNDSSKTVLFGDVPSGSDNHDRYGRTGFQQGFIHALLRYLAKDATNFSTDWAARAAELRFRETDWDLRKLSYSGANSNLAPKIVCNVMFECLLNGLPDNNTTITTWLRGKSATTLEWKLFKATGATTRNDEPESAGIVHVSSQVEPFEIECGQARWLEVSPSTNIGKLDLQDLKLGNSDNLVNPHSGYPAVIKDVKAALHGYNPKRLRISGRLYGGLTITSDFDLTVD